MVSAIAFIQWENYVTDRDEHVFFNSVPLTFSSRQERLHTFSPNDHLWLVSRCPDDQQYYFVGMFHISALQRNPPDSPWAQAFGEFSVVADRARSYDFGKQFPAEGLLRAFEFDSHKPIKFGANIGQSLQTIRVLAPHDERVLEAALRRIIAGERPLLDTPFGLWTKCDAVFADFFLKNWQVRHEPLAFLLYDPPPVLPAGAPVFIHSDKNLRLLASFCESQFVAGHKKTIEASERVSERERIWATYRADTINPPTKAEFDAFGDRQNGVRALFIMDKVIEVPTLLSLWKLYWGGKRRAGA